MSTHTNSAPTARPEPEAPAATQAAQAEPTVPPAQVWPTLRATDARGLIDFLVEAFGFVEVVAHPDDTGGIAHAQLAWPLGGGLMLGSVRPETGDGTRDGWPLRPGTCGCYVVTDDPDGLFARATAAGARVVRGPEDTDYGSREFAVADPEGNLWSFGTYRGEPRPAGRE
jgi:uncharacterized glyoxalase superfamily protein PhnB